MTDRTKGKETNIKINSEADALSDLPVTAERAEETKGGARGNVNDDGFDDIIVGTVGGAGGHVKTFG